MKFMRHSALALVVAFAAGCVQKSAPTVEYFRAHKDERGVELVRCGNDAAGSKRDAACVNAREAERLESIGSLRDLPPAGLVPQSPAPTDEEQRSKQ